jgi:hypothetical protein
MDLLKERVHKTHSFVRFEDSRRDAKLLAQLYFRSRTFQQFLLLLGPPSLGNVHDGRNDNISHARGSRIEANLNGELASVFSRANKFATCSHWTHLRGGSEFLSQTSVTLPKAGWNQYFSRSADYLIAGVAEHPFHLGIQKDDMASRIYNNNAVWRCLERYPDPII